MKQLGVLIVWGLVLGWAPPAGAQMMAMPEGKMHGGEMGMPKGSDPHEMGMDGGITHMMKMMGAIDQLGLTPEQKKKIRTLRLQHQKEAIPILGKVRMAGLEIEELLLADPVDLEAVKAKSRAKHEAMADLEVGHLQMQRQMKAILTPEQQQRLEGMMKMGHGMSYGKDKMGPPEGHKRPKGKAGKPEPKTDDPHGH